MMQPVLVTGGTGYIGTWVVRKLLEKGYTLRVTVRNKQKTEGYAHLLKLAKETPGRLEIFEADLLKENAFDEAARGCEAILHLASPFSLRTKDPVKELMEPAVKGTENVLQAANRSGSVKRVILTSSVVAIFGDNGDMQDKGLKAFTEKDFNETSSATHQPYPYSKLLAEKAAWEIAGQQQSWSLVVMNPGFVMGPSLAPNSDSESLQFMKNILYGKFRTGVPDIRFGLVDVRDVAEAHIRALENEAARGRFIICAGSASMMQITNSIKRSFPGKFKLPLAESPKFMLYLLGWAFGLTREFIRRNVGFPLAFDNQKSIHQLGMVYTDLNTTLSDMVNQMEETRLGNTTV